MWRLLQAILVFCLLGTTFLTAARLSLVWLPLASETSEAFPCAGHRCGCVSAEMCLKHCCCFGPARAPVAQVEHKSGDSTLRLVIQSPACAGGEAMGIFKLLVQVPPLDSLEFLPLGHGERLVAFTSLRPGSHSLSPDPPPPRVRIPA